MRQTTARITGVLLLLVAAAVSTQSRAMLASELEDLRVIGYHFTTRVACDKNTFSSDDPSKKRIVVFKFSATTPSDNGVLFTNDFLLRYFDDEGKEGRTSALRICAAKTAMLGEEDNCLASKSGWIKVGTGDVLFTVAFALANDIHDVDLYRVGDTATIRLSLSTNRPYSVYIATNQGTESVTDVADAIEAGGYQLLHTSNKLNAKTDGITVHYAKNVEAQAREISQRIMTKTGIVPTVKEGTFVNSDADVVIWIGK